MYVRASSVTPKQLLNQLIRYASLSAVQVTWLVFLFVAFIYCLSFQVFYGNSGILAFSLFCVLQQWGIWLVLSPLIFVLVPRLGKPKAEVWCIAGAGLSCLVLALLWRTFLAYHYASPAPWEVALLNFPNYFIATTAVCMLLFLSRMRTNSGEKYSDKIIVAKGKDQVLLKLSAIYCVKASGNYMEIYSENQEYLLRSTLKEFSEKLDPDSFFRCHRCSIVNLNFIEHIEKAPAGSGQIHLKNGLRLSLSRAYYTALRAKFSMH